MSNPELEPVPNKNAATSAKVNGVKDIEEGTTPRKKDSTICDPFATIEKTKRDLSSLGESDRVAMAWASMRSLAPETASLVAENVLGSAGYPVPEFLTPMSDARWWASLANRRELKAYAVACFERLTKHDRTSFRKYVGDAQ